MSVPGKVTHILQQDYLKKQVSLGIMTKNQITSSSVLSYNANPDQSSVLYFWQLYSVIGSDKLKKLITVFYTRIFNDNKAPWFRDVFVELGSIDYHVNGQHRFWIDSFAGGPEYKAGLKGLHFHHRLAKEIMTKKGAERWMMHMQKTLEQFKPEFNKLDTRIVPCIEFFLVFIMETYGIQFNFNVIDWVHMYVSKL